MKRLASLNEADLNTQRRACYAGVASKARVSARRFGILERSETERKNYKWPQPGIAKMRLKSAKKCGGDCSLFARLSNVRRGRANVLQCAIANMARAVSPGQMRVGKKTNALDRTAALIEISERDQQGIRNFR